MPKVYITNDEKHQLDYERDPFTFKQNKEMPVMDKFRANGLDPNSTLLMVRYDLEKELFIYSSEK